MAKCHRYILVLLTGWLCLAPLAHARPVMIEIEGGDSAFAVDEKAQTAFWVMEDCRRPLTVKSQTEADTMVAVRVDDVQLGARQVELRQQFRFNLAAPVSAEVYNSVRGGWAPVPVRVDKTCDQSAECRARMELPLCTGG